METEMKDKILSYMRDTVRRPITAEALAEELGVKGAALEPFFEVLSELEQTAAVICNRSGLYGLPERMNLVVGKLSMSGKGYGFIIPDVKQKETDTDVFVPGAMLASAMNGDRVVARVTPSEIPGRSREGEIIRIVERANTKIVGTFDAGRPKDRTGHFHPEEILRRRENGHEGRRRDYEMAGGTPQRRRCGDRAFGPCGRSGCRRPVRDAAIRPRAGVPA